MKKTYIAPELTVVHVETAQLICESTLHMAKQNGGTTSGNNITESDAREDRKSIWDDDEEDW